MPDIPDYLKPEINRLDRLITEAKASLTDPQLKPLAEEEITNLEAQKQALLTAPEPAESHSKDNSATLGKSVILEIRPGTGGEEAKIWAEDLLKK